SALAGVALLAKAGLAENPADRGQDDRGQPAPRRRKKAGSEEAGTHVSRGGGRQVRKLCRFRAAVLWLQDALGTCLSVRTGAGFIGWSADSSNYLDQLQ